MGSRPGARAEAAAQELLEAVLAMMKVHDEASLLDAAVTGAGAILGADAVVLARIGLGGGQTDRVATSPLADPAAAEAALARAEAACDDLCSVATEIEGHLESGNAVGIGERIAGHWLLRPVELGGGVVARMLVMRAADPFEDAERDALAALTGALALRLGQIQETERQRRRLRSLEATASVAAVLAPPARIDEGLAHVAQSAARMLGAAAVAVLEEPEAGAPRPDILAVAGAEARAVPDLLFGIDPLVLAAAPESDIVFVPAKRDQLVALVPLTAHLSFSGMLLCLLETGTGLRYDETEALGAFADQTALALDRAQAVHDRQELLLISDRDRIARDLHDVVIQRLFATGLRLQGMRRHLADDAVRSRFDEAVGDLDLTISDIRGTIFDLQQAPGSQARDTVREIVREYIPLLGFTPVVRTSGPVDTLVAGDLLDQVAAVLRECLSNMMRHARAGAAVVELEAADRQVVLRVADDGVGMPAAPGRRSGLENMSVRAEALGGGSRAYAGPDGGAVVEWWAPLAADVGTSGAP